MQIRRPISGSGLKPDGAPSPSDEFIRITSPPSCKAAGQKTPLLPPSLPAAAKMRIPFSRAARIAVKIGRSFVIYLGKPNDRLIMSTRSLPVEKWTIACQRGLVYWVSRLNGLIHAYVGNFFDISIFKEPCLTNFGNTEVGVGGQPEQ